MMAPTAEPRATEKPGDNRESGSTWLREDVDLKNDPLGVLQKVEDPDKGRSEEEKHKLDKRLMLKVDLYLIPWLSLLYLISFLDRTNIGNAKIEGLQEDLNMSNSQYNNTLTVFFITYSLAEPLTQVLLKRLKPSIFIPIIMILWAICTEIGTQFLDLGPCADLILGMTTMGLVHNYGGLITARFFLGLTEAGLFPGIQFYLSCWYKRSEFGIRSAIFFSAAALAGSFGGLLAAAIASMDGVGGKRGWQWIFILEGLFTLVIAVVSFWMVHDFPDEATFLKDDERRRVLRRLAVDKQGSSKHEEFKMVYVRQVLKDWKTYSGMVVYMGCDGVLYAFSLFIPTIIRDMGYSSTKAQLLSVPPYAVAAVVTVVIGWVADRTQRRGQINMIMALFGVAGFSMLISTDNSTVQYAGTFIGALGIYPCIPNTITWAANNFEGVYARGVALGFIIGWGNLNGVVASNIYRQSDAPRFFIGHGVAIAYEGLFLFGGSLVQHIGLRIENKRRRQGKLDYLVEGMSEEEITELGDRRPDFMYTL